jgi:hypothetical protein
MKCQCQEDVQVRIILIWYIISCLGHVVPLDVALSCQTRTACWLSNVMRHRSRRRSRHWLVHYRICRRRREVP